MSRLRFAVIGDTHVRTEPVDTQAGYPSDALHNARNRRVADILRQRGGPLVVHLGDITHAIPALPSYDAYQQVARRIYAGLDLQVAPGNHDVGDKPGAQVNAPVADDPAHARFESWWGPSWRSFTRQGVRFVLLDAPVMGTGLARDRAQRAWLEALLAQPQRTFLFLHYPPFIESPDEPAHYDNLDPEPRAWLLELLRRHPVEAVFAGHVHTFFYNRWQGVPIYALPGVAFNRPEYAELCPTAPHDDERENGRNDPDKLGFFMVHLDEQGHRVELIRHACPGHHPRPPAPCRLGAWLDTPWQRVVDLPPGDLDPLRRKQARDDHALLALWDVGISWVRLPASDRSPRLADLRARGHRIVLYSAGLPDPDMIQALASQSDLFDLWEIILPTAQLGQAGAALARCDLPVALSRIRDEADDSGYFSHFPDQGFRADKPTLARLAELPDCVQAIAFRVEEAAEVPDCVRAAGALGRQALCHVRVPRGTERLRQIDPDRVTRLVLEAAQAARAHPEALVFLDTFIDKDRGYYPRDGLFDRCGRPRPAALALRDRS